MIESVDSLKLLKEINKQAAKHDRVVKVLLELHLAEEDTKSGLSIDACREPMMNSRLPLNLMRLPSSSMR